MVYFCKFYYLFNAFSNDIYGDDYEYFIDKYFINTLLYYTQGRLPYQDLSCTLAF